MKTGLRGWSIAAIAAAMFTGLTGCVTTDGGYEASYGVDYYEPYGYEYGRLHPGYHVAPPRRDPNDRQGRENRQPPVRVDNRPTQPPARVDNRPSRPAYQPAPPSRPAPSIPSKPRERPR
jgi:hypothetical protein